MNAIGVANFVAHSVAPTARIPPIRVQLERGDTPLMQRRGVRTRLERSGLAVRRRLLVTLGA